MRADKAETAHGLFTTMEAVGIGQVIRIENFSSFRRLLSVTAKVLKFCCLLLQSLHPGATTAGPGDLAKAEVLWVVESQKALVRNKGFTQWQKQFEMTRGFGDAEVVSKMLICPTQPNILFCLQGVTFSLPCLSRGLMREYSMVE